MAAAPTPAAGYQISQLELGIGDILCSLYGLNGFSQGRGRPPIVLHLRDHFDWLQLVNIPGLRTVPYLEAHSPPMDFVLGDSEADYREKLRGGHDPKIWYADKLGALPLTPSLNRGLLDTPPPFARPYVVVAPFTTRVNRTWEVHNWRILAKTLEAAGYAVIALDAPGQPERCKPVGVEYFWGQPPSWTANVCAHADLVISGDSALAHLGGLLQVKTLVILSQQDPAKYYSLTANAFVRPAHACVGCRFQPERGYEEKCDFGCWTLQSISPRTVTEQALCLLGADS